MTLAKFPNQFDVRFTRKWTARLLLRDKCASETLECVALKDTMHGNDPLLPRGNGLWRPVYILRNRRQFC